MRVYKQIDEIRRAVGNFKSQGKSIAFVPTMGALHDGHLALVRQAKARADIAIVSIFVNPTQFENPDDLAAYPRDVDADLVLLQAEGVDAVFTPTPDAMYPAGAETIVETTALANMLHGEVRPGHFRGVATVVTKFLNIVTPDIAVFGEKDYQQLQVIRTLARDLFLPVQIAGIPTVREADGLAMSSRNARLSPEDREAAVVLNRALDLADQMVAEGTTIDALGTAVREKIEAERRASNVAIDIVAAETLAPLVGPIATPVALMISAQFGDVLLIDQRVTTP